MKAYFDARLITFPKEKEGEIVNHMICRSLFDCERNAYSTWARNFYSAKALEGKSKKEMIEMLNSQGVHWDTQVPFFLKHGVYVKRENFEIESPQGNKVIRSKLVFKTMKIKYGEFFINLMLNKYWNDNKNELKENGVENIDLESLF